MQLQKLAHLGEAGPEKEEQGVENVKDAYLGVWNVRNASKKETMQTEG